MRPISIKRNEQNSLTIIWDDGASFDVELTLLRDQCPCAMCAGETLLLGKHVQMPLQLPLAGHYELESLAPVGNYAIGATWRDGHNTGLYTWEHLRSICERVS